MGGAKTIEVTRWTGTTETIAAAEATTTGTGDDSKIHRTCIEFLLTGSAAAAEQTVPKTCPTSCVTTTQQKPDRTIQTHTSLQLSHESYRISGGFPATPSSSSTTTNPSAVRQEANETSDLSRLVFPLVSKLGRRRQ